MTAEEKERKRQKDYYDKNRQKRIDYSVQYRKKHIEKARQYNKRYYYNNLKADRICKIKNAYGLEFEDMKKMYIAQQGCCAICSTRFTCRKDINVDHNHSTGQIRQLLCKDCNRGIGIFKENPIFLHRAAEYINKWNNL